MNISEFERTKPHRTFRKINAAIKKYDKIVKDMPIMDDEDAIKVEMAADFTKELENIKKSFAKGE
tara:strand:- start:140 stop:334 length:195 start_codon:yes stop_codon:yes gene_type:complete